MHLGLKSCSPTPVAPSQIPEIDAAAKELTMRRLLPPLPDQNQHLAASQNQPHEMNALFGLLSVVFLDATLRRAEGWDGEPSTRSSSVKRQDAVGAIKGVLGTFCSLDEDRRFGEPSAFAHMTSPAIACVTSSAPHSLVPPCAPDLSSPCSVVHRGLPNDGAPRGAMGSRTLAIVDAVYFGYH